jgi:hypothetical protein
MAYIVQADVPGSDDGASISLGDRVADDFDTCIAFAQPPNGCRKCGLARIYTPDELAVIVADKSTTPP